MVKKQLGQFYTSNSDYILTGFEKYVKNKDVTDPFSGACDLLEWAKKNNARKINGFDIDPKDDSFDIKKGDSILKPKRYKFVLTNPPYLNINKASSETKKKYFDKFSYEDLYQISLDSIYDSDEGIIILPINFLSSRNAKKIRDKFFLKFKIVKMNYFKQQVFDDTTYNVISFYFKKRKKISSKTEIETFIYPESKKILIPLSRDYNWQIGGDFIKKINSYKNVLGIKRLVEQNINKGPSRVKVALGHIKYKDEICVADETFKILNKNIILLKSIDSGSKTGKICLEDIRQYNLSGLISKQSSRNMIHLIFPDNIDIKTQEKLIDIFNYEFNKARKKYLSLFLTNFRDKDRKRVSFDFVYKFLNYLLLEKVGINSSNELNLNYECLGR